MQGGKSSNYARMLNEEDNNNYSRQCPGPKRLGVTFLASEWGSSKGGLSTLNRELAINIAKDPRVKVSYFVPSCNDEDKTAAHSHKVELIKAARRPGLDELEWLNFPPKDLQIDVVVGHGVKLGHQAQIIRESHECKWIQVVHTDPEELGIYKEYANPISNAQKKHKTEVELCELADFVVPVGPKLYKAFRSYLASCEKEQCFFEFTPGILAEFSELKQSLEKREVCKVLCFGRGDSEDFKLKGFDIAARAMAKLSHCILLFVGAAEGKLKETRTRFLDFGIPPSQLRVRPFLDSREDLKKVFCEADLVVMPSRTEGFGLTGLEALSAGLPILVSRKSGFAEALLKIPFGRHFVVDSDDQDQWAKAIGEVCNNDRSSRLEECETLRDTYKKKYSWKKQCESLIDKMISITLDDKPEDCACAAEKSSLPHQTEVNNGLCSDKPEDCACAAEKSTLPHQTEVNNGLCSVSAHSAPGKLPIRIKLNRATFQGSQSKDPAQEEEAKRLLMCEMTKHFIEIHAAQIPSKKFSQSLCYYLQGVHDLMIREAGEGSLRIVVECKTLEILEHLWDDYSSGHLNEVAEERLLTDEIKKKYDVESIELETTITMEDYLACKLSLRDLNRDSTVAENLTDPANAQPLVVHDEEQRELTTARFSLNLDSGRSARPNEFHPEQENGSLRLVSEMLSEEKTSQSSSMELPTYFRHVTVTQDSAPTKERDNSLQFSVGCRDLESLELLWSDYRSGRLDWMAEKFLLTDDIKKRFHVESVTLETSILEEDYLACKEHLLNISQNSGNSLMGDDDDTEILVTERTIQTANTDDLGIQTSKEAIYQLPNQSETVIPVEEKSETTEEQQIIAGKMIENSGNSFVGDGEDTEILLAEGAIQTANTDDLGIQTSIEAISQLVDHSKTVIPVEEKNETTEEQQIIAGKIIGLQEGKGFSDVFDTHESPPSKDGKERRLKRKALKRKRPVETSLKKPGVFVSPHGSKGDVIDPRTSLETQLQLLDIIDGVGTCWRELGPKLNISALEVQQLDEGYRFNREKANALLLMWKEREGRRAVVGRLVDALRSIGRNSIADKLLEQEMKELIVSEDQLRKLWSHIDRDYTLPSSMPNFLTSAWKDESHDKFDARIQGDAIDPRTSLATQLQLLDIIDGVGTCWRELGPKLDISALEVQQLDEGYRFNREKANALLLVWEEKEGRRAVAGRLVDALRSIGRESIADKLLEYCTEISRRTCEVSHRQLYDIIDDVDTCWRELGPKLNISEVDVQKRDEEFPYNRNRAMTLLFMWKEREGRRAVAGLLADALLSIGRKDIAEKLLGLQQGEGSSYIMDTYKSRRYSKDDEGQNSKLSTAHGPLQRVIGQQRQQLIERQKRIREASLARLQLLKSAHKFKGLQEGKVSSDILDTSKIRRYSKDGKDDDKKSKLYTAHCLKPDSSISAWNYEPDNESSARCEQLECLNKRKTVEMCRAEEKSLPQQGRS